MTRRFRTLKDLATNRRHQDGNRRAPPLEAFW